MNHIVMVGMVDGAEQPFELIGKAVNEQQIRDHFAHLSARREKTGDASACRANSSGSHDMGDFFEG
uniref:Uncharacterized protein n=1 Tax=viral metagenome TaxID=1070528 RepID=A0A6H1ZK48_9ZZZZ